jgi:hypothetical protein
VEDGNYIVVWDSWGEYFGSALNNTIVGVKYTNLNVLDQTVDFLVKLLLMVRRERAAGGGELRGSYTKP